MFLITPGFEDVHVGQHYQYLASGGARLDEEVLATGFDTLTFRITRQPVNGAATSVERKIPRDVVWFIKKYLPERGLDSFGTLGYDAAYYKTFMSTYNFEASYRPQDERGHERVRISAQGFACTLYSNTVLAKTTHGCVQITSTTLMADRFPFTLRASSNGEPILMLKAIR